MRSHHRRKCAGAGRVVVAEDCTLVHREKEPPGAKQGALRIIRNALKAEVLPLAEIK